MICESLDDVGGGCPFGLRKGVRGVGEGGGKKKTRKK